MRKSRSDKFAKKSKSSSLKEKTQKKQHDKPAKDGLKHVKRHMHKIHKKRDSLNRKGILFWGIHAVSEALLNPKRVCYRLWITDSAFKSIKDILDKVEKLQIRMPEIIKSQKSDIDHFLPKGSVHQGMALEVENLPDFSLDDMLGDDDCPDVILILDQVTDPHNIGAIMRSAAAFGVGAIITTEKGCPTINGVIAKIACGGAEHVPFIKVTNLSRAIESLKQENFWCIGLAEEGKEEFCKSKLSKGRIAIILGAEGEGLRQLTRKKCDELAFLPTKPPISSVNVSNAAAIAIYEVFRQRN